MTSSSAIGRLLRPRSVAIVGASPTPGSLGGSVMQNLQRFGFDGDLHLVNPSRGDIDGKPCVKTTRDLPHGVDCAILAIPGAAVLEALRGCAERGVGGAIVFSAGFAEAGPAGREAQADLARIAIDGGMAIEGPNCLGMINYVDRVPLTFSTVTPLAEPMTSGIAVVSQSGAMATVLRAALQARDLPVSFSISTGNEAVTGIEDFLDYLLDDSATSAFALVIEQVREPKRFLDLARRARIAGKQVVLLHPGRSAAAKESAATHTGALAGDWMMMRTLVSYEGVIVVESLEELIDVSEILLRCPSLPRSGTAVLTDSGAFKGIVLDYAEDIHLSLPQPDAQTKEALGSIAPGLILPTNPLDLTAQALIDPQLYNKCLEPLLADDRYSSIVLAVIMSSTLLARRKVQPILDFVAAARPTKPILFAMLGDEAEVPADVIADIRRAGIPFLRSPERAMRALARFSRAARRPTAPLSQMPVKSSAHPLPVGTVPEYRSKQLLAEFGVPFPDAEFVSDLEGAQAAAKRLGWPVALKAQSAELPHKTEAGGVILHLRDEAGLATGWARLHDNIADYAQEDLVLDGVLVEAMAKPGFEMIVGARNDPDWGAIVVVGMGGIFAEAIRDVRLMPAAFNAQAIANEIGLLKGAAVLEGFRGEAPRDVAAAAAIAEALGRFVAMHPEVREIELNPLVVYEDGKGAVALDALIQVA